MKYRKTILTRGHISIRSLQLQAARTGGQGVLVTGIGGLAARLAGGFLRHVDSDSLRRAVSQALPVADLGELASIAGLPGMATAVARSLQQAWLAGIDLQQRQGQDGRLQALAGIESAALRLLPAGMLPAPELVQRALARVEHAPAVTGPVEVRGLTDVDPVYRPLLAALARHVPVTWHTVEGFAPPLLPDTGITVVTSPRQNPRLSGNSAGTAFSEVQDAMRWVRQLLADGIDAGDIALAAASPDEFDAFFLAARDASGIPVHFGHGIPVTGTHPGQSAAALADILVRGLSRTRMQRLNDHLQSSSDAFSPLPEEWIRVLPPDAPLDRPVDWTRLVGQLQAEGWAQAGTLDRIVALLQRGAGHAAEVGEALLPDEALAAWRRALLRGPASAVDQTLDQLRVFDTTEASSSVVWLPAALLQADPRPYVRLLGLNSSRWPRGAAEDALLPDHVIPARELTPVTLTQQDRFSFGLILATTEKEVVLSWSRRGAAGRRLARSALLPAGLAETRTHRHDVPAHAYSESDRLLARPDEHSRTAQAVAAQGTWQAWLRPELTPQDGIVRQGHPVIGHSVRRRMSATSLRRLLRHPAAYVWHYGLGMTAPETGRSGLQLDQLAYGSLVHEILEQSIGLLEAGVGLLAAGPELIAHAVLEASGTVSQKWLLEQPTPPRQLWERQVEEVRRGIVSVLTGQPGAFGAGRAYAEIPFGGSRSRNGRQQPWDPGATVVIPGTGLRLTGYIDHMNVSADGSRVQVVDYKTGAPPGKPDSFELDGGQELQRSIYAYAVRSLLGAHVQVETSLVFLRTGLQLSLADPQATLEKVAAHVTAAVESLQAGAAVPGPDAEHDYDDFRLALPASNKRYLERKKAATEELLPHHAELWSLP